MPPLRLGLLGCGGVAFWVHLRSLRRMTDVVLVVAADPDPAARQRAARLSSAEFVAEPARVLERNDVDAVLIATPNQSHAPLALAALEAGKHLYLEKPVAIDGATARTLQRAAALTPLVAVVGFNRRFHPAARRARELIAAGRVGRVRAVQSLFSESVAPEAMPQWKRRRETGGGALLDLGSHHFDLVRWILADEPATVRATASSDTTEHDSVDVTVAFASGVTMQGYFSFHAGTVDRLDIVGDAGHIRVDRHANAPQLWRARRAGYGVRRALVGMSLADRRSAMRRWVHPSEDPSYVNALRAFVARVRGARNESATIVDGVRALALVLAAETAARDGNAVTLTHEPADR
ncbi:MAG TPA: Gfo/Idh/MocA family oxidoreductase [Methylomirabilota bacterium]|nr:Gfo/Idh/MocA family oxidoreductase [Methylomirabilota bacterium]